MGLLVQTVKKDMTMNEIQKILNSGGYIIFEQATYDITQTLYLHSNTKLDLNGARLRQASDINHILLTYSDAETIEYEGVHDVCVFNGTIEGMGKYGSKINLITLCHTRNIYLKNLNLVDVVEFHSLEINSSQNVKVEDCLFRGFNSTIDDDDFRESIQIDHAIESALVVVPLGSPWYDGTPCENIVIDGCVFEKSSSRPTPSQCIGNHCQVTGRKHSNITIQNCTFNGGNQTNKGGSCITIVDMENVKILNNICTQYGRFVRVTTFSYTYGIDGKLETLLAEDGISRNVLIEGNSVVNPTGTYLSSGVYVSSQTGNHESIIVKENSFNRGDNTKMKYAVDMKYVNGGIVADNDINDLVINVSKTCNGVYQA